MIAAGWREDAIEAPPVNSDTYFSAICIELWRKLGDGVRKAA
jgi:hypothetical protein